jgi:hypothetical protein
MTTSRHSDGARELGIVGTGRVAKSLGVLLNRRGFQIAAVAGRSVESAREAARFVGSTEAVVIHDLPQYASRILIAISDDAIAPVAQALAQGNLRSGIVLHTAAAGGPGARRFYARKITRLAYCTPCKPFLTPRAASKRFRARRSPMPGMRPPSRGPELSSPPWAASRSPSLRRNGISTMPPPCSPRTTTSR